MKTLIMIRAAQVITRAVRRPTTERRVGACLACQAS